MYKTKSPTLYRGERFRLMNYNLFNRNKEMSSCLYHKLCSFDLSSILEYLFSFAGVVSTFLKIS